MSAMGQKRTFGDVRRRSAQLDSFRRSPIRYVGPMARWRDVRRGVVAALHISLFGGFEARLGSGEALPLKGRKTQALVAYLALTPGEQHTRDELVALLWSDRGEQQARSSLRQSLSELRKALGDGDDSPLIAGRDARR